MISRMLFSLCAALWVTAAHAVTYDYYVATDQNAAQQILPYETAETAVQFYDYDSVFRPTSAKMPFAAGNGQASGFMHRNTNTGVLSLGIQLNRHTQSVIVGNNATVKLSVSGAPSGSFISVFDDIPEPGNVDIYPDPGPNGDYSLRYNLARTDGFMISGFENLDFTVTVAFVDTVEEPNPLTQYRIINAGAPNPFVSPDTTEFIFSSQVRPVPVPATGLLLIGALGRLTVLRRRARRQG